MITSKIIGNGILRAVLILILVALGLYFLYLISSVIIYMIVALIVTLILNPIVEFLQRRLKFRPILAITTTLSLVFVLLVLFFLLFIPLISSQTESLALLKIEDIEKNIAIIYNQFENYLAGHNLALDDSFKSFNLASYLDLGLIPSFFNNFIAVLGSFGVGIGSIIFITFFFLKDKKLFILGVKLLIPDTYETEILNSLNKINRLLSRYFIGLLIQLSIVFILYLIVLLIFDVSNPIIIALLCAILNIIPYLGPLIGSILAALLTMIGKIGGDFQTEILPTTIYVLIGFFIVQLIDNNLNQPLIFSKSTKSHPVEIFLVILIAGFISGILGMIVAVPTYTIVKVILKEFFPNNTFIRYITFNM
jgi:predicted PurR-regulated permease PerM